MIDDKGYFRWSPQDKGGPDEVLTDLYHVSIINSTDDRFRAYRLGKGSRTGSVERLDGYKKTPPPSFISYVPNVAENVDILIADRITKFYTASVKGLLYISQGSDSGLQTYVGGGEYKFYHAVIWRTDRLTTDNVPMRLARIFWNGDVEVTPPTDTILKAIGDRERVTWDLSWLGGPSPYNAPIKDMSAFDAQLEAVLGRAAARAYLKEISNVEV